MIQTCSGPQNDRLNFSEKLARNGPKMAAYYSASFPLDYRSVLIWHLSVFNLYLITTGNKKRASICKIQMRKEESIKAIEQYFASFLFD